VKAFSESAFRHHPFFHQETDMANLRMGYIGKSFSLGILGIVGTLVACGGGGITSTVANTPPSPFVLFASNYIVENGNSPIAKSLEGGNVDEFYGGNFNKGWDGLKGFIPQKQAIAIQQNTSVAATDANSYAGIVIKAPNNSSLNISSSTYLTIQLGNSSPTGGLYAVANSHEKFEIELKKDTLACKTSQQMAARTPEGKESLRTYKIDLSTFQCSGGTMDELKLSIKEVVVLTKGGLDTTASAVANTVTEINVGLIAFGG
jgi:hypothetical protein